MKIASLPKVMIMSGSLILTGCPGGQPSEISTVDTPPERAGEEREETGKTEETEEIPSIDQDESSSANSPAVVEEDDSASLSPVSELVLTSSKVGHGITISFDSPGAPASGFLILRNTSAISDSPSNGLTYTLGETVGTSTVAYVGTSTSVLDAGLTKGETYHYSVFSYDSSNTYAAAVSADATTVSYCDSVATGGEWVGVPGDSNYGTDDFCLMKYEGTYDSGAISDGATSPTAARTQTQVISDCNALGAGFHLVSNAEWLTAAGNIANTAVNWSGSSNDWTDPNRVVGEGQLNRGKTDYSHPGPAGSGITKRTHTLSNGDEIWDLSGGLREWTSDTWDGTDKIASAGEFTALTETDSMKLTDLISAEAIANGWSTTEGIGEYTLGENDTTSVILRGGSYATASVRGIFTVSFQRPSRTFTWNGWRCALTIP